jgi:hypothetical protein
MGLLLGFVAHAANQQLAILAPLLWYHIIANLALNAVFLVLIFGIKVLVRFGNLISVTSGLLSS